jgi:hypothetical protein
MGSIPRIWAAIIFVLEKGHYVHTKLHDDWFRHSSNINVITSAIWNAAVLEVLMGGMYEVRS